MLRDESINCKRRIYLMNLRFDRVFQCDRKINK